MDKKLASLFIFTVFVLWQAQVHAVQENKERSTQITVVQTASKAISYRNLKQQVEIDFGGTVLLPDGRGSAVIKNKEGVIEIKAKFREMTPATQLGAEYLTYILWAISPNGEATNLGELTVKNGKSQVKAKVQFQAMSLIVTAEPYFAVSQPSDAMVLENAIKPVNEAAIEIIDAKYELLPRGEYTRNIPFQALVMDKKTPFYVYQARNAVRIAKAVDADRYAPEPFNNARRLLALAETDEEGWKERTMTAREAVQKAEDSRSIAVKKQISESIRDDINQSRDQVKSANTRAAAAIIGQSKAETAQEKAEEAMGKSDNERAAALALATSATASSTASQSEAKAARSEAAISKGQADAANTRAAKAESEKANLRKQLYKQLNSIFQTQDTARGLIVNMPDSLFKTDSSELQPRVREKLAKIAGIITSNPGLKLEIEGHTDNTGADQYNQKLSEKRAQTAMDYLISQGVTENSIGYKGFGKSAPIASNDTAQGRQKNRRVEIIMTGDAIGTWIAGK
ncbi:MAG TPA: flagellar motor protein MotB [Elusimicrobia bacterium]|nr:MAG: hypothetical protein A2278_00505 [Elusimicrobia bacterium RIFOXYA12_FULL_49_49]OGS11023.1 MAG: hypothetical protein A2386_00400 [Elusimicrobia bacterium RIFOXYB1_FULL_48_9]OGS15140.1 MAG: hypothetical protein A2251_00515 [Elusimicrobia bacterium RIFOXYA2_FULL_47_53]OGS29760.1 MAG: hypothetical protein A2323_01315 [Elusimicrobia bacterium RIFOXYB2_FULL_46_23]HBU70241.1 flagellar motor protein MotB [Elusimicrobiota bacterium]